MARKLTVQATGATVGAGDEGGIVIAFEMDASEGEVELEALVPVDAFYEMLLALNKIVVDGPTGVIYERTGAYRVPRDGEDYLIAPGVVGTVCHAVGDLWRDSAVILRRLK